MSVVGPRPPLPEEVASYTDWQEKRLSVTPGLTCIWQVSGRNRLSFEEWMNMDIDYIERWSLLLDSEAYFKDFQSRYYARWGLLRIEASDDVEFKGADVSVFFYIMTAY